MTDRHENLKTLLVIIHAKKTAFVNDDEYSKLTELAENLQPSALLRSLKRLLHDIEFKRRDQRPSSARLSDVVEILDHLTYNDDIVNPIEFDIVPDAPIDSISKRIPRVEVFAYSTAGLKGVLRAVRDLKPVVLSSNQTKTKSMVINGSIVLSVPDGILTKVILDYAAQCSDCVIMPIELFANASGHGIPNTVILKKHRGEFRYVELYEHTVNGVGKVQEKAILKSLKI